MHSAARTTASSWSMVTLRKGDLEARGEEARVAAWETQGFLSVFLGWQVLHTEVPRVGVESKVQLPAYTTVTAMWDPSHICDYPTAHGNAGSLTH